MPTLEKSNSMQTTVDQSSVKDIPNWVDTVETSHQWLFKRVHNRNSTLWLWCAKEQEENNIKRNHGSASQTLPKIGKARGIVRCILRFLARQTYHVKLS